VLQFTEAIIKTIFISKNKWDYSLLRTLDHTHFSSAETLPLRLIQKAILALGLLDKTYRIKRATANEKK
jgi:hypothetical protein